MKNKKNTLLSIYALAFILFMFFSSVKFMYELLSDFLPLPAEFLLTIIIAIHIGSSLLILSGRLKDNN